MVRMDILLYFWSYGESVQIFTIKINNWVFHWCLFSDWGAPLFSGCLFFWRCVCLIHTGLWMSPYRRAGLPPHLSLSPYAALVVFIALPRLSDCVFIYWLCHPAKKFNLMYSRCIPHISNTAWHIIGTQLLHVNRWRNKYKPFSNLWIWVSQEPYSKNRSLPGRKVH